MFFVWCVINLEFSICFPEYDVKMSLKNIMGIKILFQKSLWFQKLHTRHAKYVIFTQNVKWGSDFKKKSDKWQAEHFIQLKIGRN